jgi:GNAT superfamily N-acetyltransferase
VAGASVAIRSLRETDAAVIAAAFEAIGWSKTVEQYQRYLREQAAGVRHVLVATLSEAFAGYVTLSWQSTYPFFRDQQLPEIQDLNVLPQFRRGGVGSALLDAAEARAAASVRQVGIRVGLDRGYAAAQRLYVRRGYVPDGLGLACGDRAVAFGESVVVDHDLLLSFTKAV